MFSDKDGWGGWGWLNGCFLLYDEIDHQYSYKYIWLITILDLAELTLDQAYPGVVFTLYGLGG